MASGTVLCEDEGRSCPQKLMAAVGGLSLFRPWRLSHLLLRLSVQTRTRQR
jgi:hypothetical protein